MEPPEQIPHHGGLYCMSRITATLMSSVSSLNSQLAEFFIIYMFIILKCLVCMVKFTRLLPDWQARLWHSLKGRASNGQKMHLNVTCCGLRATMLTMLHLPLNQTVWQVYRLLCIVVFSVTVKLTLSIQYFCLSTLLNVWFTNWKSVMVVFINKEHTH